MAAFFYDCITLDGYLATKEHSLDWLYDTVVRMKPPVMNSIVV